MLHVADNGIPTHGGLGTEPIKNDALHRRRDKIFLDLLLKSISIDTLDIGTEDGIPKKLMFDLHGTLNLRSVLDSAIVPYVRRNRKRSNHKKNHY